MATKECAELQQQGLIEPTNSPWGCHAFYVNKRSEQIWEKQRLVIDYQPLNHFLADDKFPLPNRHTLFSSLSNAKVFLKFDLKAGFWQLGIKLEDRPKTVFSIPNHHFLMDCYAIRPQNSSITIPESHDSYIQPTSKSGPYLH